MEVNFLTTLDVRYVSGKEWVLLAPFVVSVGDRVIRVPDGFITDFASVPRIPLAFMLFGGIGERAATVHDWLYASKIVSRAEADKIFKVLLKAEGAGLFSSNMMYAGVRAGGWTQY